MLLGDSAAPSGDTLYVAGGWDGGFNLQALPVPFHTLAPQAG